MRDTAQTQAARAIVRRWHEFDVDGILDLLDDEVEFTYAIGVRPATGKARIRRLLEGLGAHQRNLNWQIINIAQAGNIIFLEGLDDYRNPSDHHVQTPHVTVFEFRGTKIVKWRDYFDLRTLETFEAGEPPSDWFTEFVAAASVNAEPSGTSADGRSKP